MGDWESRERAVSHQRVGKDWASETLVVVKSSSVR